MKDFKKKGQLAGIFLVIMVGSGIPGVMFRGLSSSLLENQELTALILEKSPEMRLSIFLSFIAGIAGLLFAVTAHNVVKHFSGIMANMFLAIWITHTSVALVGDIFHYALLESAQYSSEVDFQSFVPLAAISIKGYIGAHFLSLTLFGGLFVFLHTLCFKYDLLPKWLTIWGMVATGLVFGATWFQIFDQSVSFHFYNQNGLFMITFTIYLLIKGFNRIE